MNKFIFFLATFTLLGFSNKTYSFESNSQKEIYKLENNKNQSKITKNLESEYLLGSGDSILILFSGIDIFSKVYTIDVNGYLNLPEVEKIYVKNLSLKELESKLEKEYSKFIINPKFILEIKNFRAVTFFISGEVKNPGLYTLEYNNNNIKKPTNNLIPNYLNFSGAPKLYNAIQKARGVTNNADLSNITIVRENSKSQGGGKIKSNINLLSLILNGDQSQNITIHDGDHIKISKSSEIIKEQILAINQANLNPNTITVYVTGNVVRGGPVELKKGTSLTQAIASTGGKKLMTGNVEFIRFNDDGSVKRNSFRYSSKAQINSSKNPILMDGDVINVNKTILGNTTEVLGEIASPVITGFGIYKIFND